MHVTEDEAKTKVCPRTIGQFISDAGSYGELQAFNATEKCIDSNCMAWQWLKVTNVNTGKQYGYCGLSGKPEL